MSDSRLLLVVVAVVTVVGCAGQQFEEPGREAGESVYAAGPQPEVGRLLPLQVSPDVERPLDEVRRETAARAAILERIGLAGAAVQVAAEGPRLVLEGAVPTDAAASSAADAVRSVEGVEQVENRLEAGPAQDGDRQLLRDRLRELHVRLALLDAIGEPALGLQVRALRQPGHVSVRGPLPEYGANRERVLEVARSVAGVREVRDLLAVAPERT